MKNLILIITGVASALLAQAEGSVKIRVTLTPAGSFIAKSDKLKGDLIKVGNTLTAEKLSLAIDTLKTGMTLRDEHFCKHLGCTEHPKAILTALKGTEGKAKGILELNGVKKEIEINYLEKGSEITATFVANAQDFKIPHAQYLGVAVNDEISAEVTLGMIKK